jgi:hypothetical protein
LWIRRRRDGLLREIAYPEIEPAKSLERADGKATPERIPRAEDDAVVLRARLELRQRCRCTGASIAGSYFARKGSVVTALLEAVYRRE